MKSGQRVRIKTAPERVGVLTGEPQESGGKVRWRVQFPEKLQRLPEGNLELLDDTKDLTSLLVKKRFGKAEILRIAVTHARLSGQLADIVYSMEASNTDFYAYQYKPVLNFLESPSNGILIADEVGLGKTIEAGLIWTELSAREDAQRLLILCPAVLREKWKFELAKRFGIRAEIVDSQMLLTRLQDTTIHSDHFALIGSLQGLRPPRNWEDPENKRSSAELARFFAEESISKKSFDCVIIDEAHYLRNSGSQTHELGQIIREATKDIILLSATPIQLRSDDLFQLLRIIDPDNFSEVFEFRKILAANEPLTSLVSLLRRTSPDLTTIEPLLKECLANPLLRKNRLLKGELENVAFTNRLEKSSSRIELASRIERVNILSRVINRTRKRDVQERRVLREVSSHPVSMTTGERRFYDLVSEEVRRYSFENELFDEFLLTIPQRQMCSSIPAAIRAWSDGSNWDHDISEEKRIDDIDTEVTFQNSNYNKPKQKDGPLKLRLKEAVRRFLSETKTVVEDSKYLTLSNIFKNYQQESNGGKLIVFSFYRETLKYLAERLEKDGFQTVVLMGGMGNEKQELLEKFENDATTDLLLTSEILSEGVDLQFCSALVNYDLPWNPMRVEQRIGRIDRIGQKEKKILILNMFYEDSLDDRIYNRLYSRLNIFSRALGDIENVLGEKVREVTLEILRHDLSPEQELEMVEQTSIAIENAKQIQEDLESEAVGLAAHSDYILNQVTAAREMGRYIDGKSLWIYVRDFFEKSYPGTRLVVKNNAPLVVDVELSHDAKIDFGRSISQNSRATRSNLISASSGKLVACQFHNNFSTAGRNNEVINHAHPLIKFISEKQKSLDFSQTSAISITERAGTLERGIYLILIKRWSITGIKRQEFLKYFGISLSSQKFLDSELSELMIMASIDRGESWGRAGSMTDSDSLIANYNALDDFADQKFDEFVARKEMENHDQIDFSIETINSRYSRQISSRRAAIETLKARGNHKMLPLQEGRIERLTSTWDNLVLELEKNRAIHSEPSDVILCLVEVKASE